MEYKYAEDQAKYLNDMMHDRATKHPDPTTVKGRKNRRLRFQHDRDRIVWSPGFKRLAHKTQVFPQVYNDHHRRRLTHSLEVMQLSTSIARTLGLNFILCEAIALGHDLGHTPFGHAGEEALNDAFEKMSIQREGPDLKEEKKGFGQFNHYEQGVDVVSYMERSTPDPKVPGLDLRKETREGILKHTYDHKNGISKSKSLKYLVDKSKYNLGAGHGTLEAQVVRICDKISYLISDLEDGLLIGAIHIEDLEEFRIFNFIEDADRTIIDNTGHRIFVRGRNKLLTRLVNSVLKTSQSRLSASKNQGLTIDVGPNVKKQMKKVWDELQTGILFKHLMVERSNNRAKHIVNCLTCTYLRNPELIPWRFRSEYVAPSSSYYKAVAKTYGIDDLSSKESIDISKWKQALSEKMEEECPQEYNETLELRLGELICVKDYVPGMTDNFAEECFSTVVSCFSSRRVWENRGWDSPKMIVHP